MKENETANTESTLAGEAQGREIVVPLHEEQISISKHVVDTGGVQVIRKTVEQEAQIDEMLTREQVEIERIPVGKAVDQVPVTRQEGDTLIVPVVEEVLVIERRLVLKEEVRLRRVSSAERHQETVTLRKQEAAITKLPPKAAQDGADG